MRIQLTEPGMEGFNGCIGPCNGPNDRQLMGEVFFENGISVRGDLRKAHLDHINQHHACRRYDAKAAANTEEPK